MNIVKEAMIKGVVSIIEKNIGKIAKKFTVNLQDDGEAGFTVNIKVFDSLNTVVSNATKTLSGLLKKKG